MTEQAQQIKTGAGKKIDTRCLVESAIMIALATILSELKVIPFVFGGGITICAMVPIILLSYRWGMKRGFFCAFVFGVIQLLIGIAKHSFGFELWIVIVDVLLEYVLAYTMLGLGGVFRNRFKSPVAALTLGGLAAIFARYLLHFIAGVAIWGSYAEWFFTEDAGVSIGESVMNTFHGFGLSVVYSGVVNGSLMIGEMIVSVIALVVIAKIPAISKKMV